MGLGSGSQDLLALGGDVGEGEGVALEEALQLVLDVLPVGGVWGYG